MIEPFSDATPLLIGNCIGLAWLAARSQLAAHRARMRWMLTGLGAWDPETNLLSGNASDAELARMREIASTSGHQLSALVIRLDPRDPLPAARALAEGIRASDAAWRIDHDTVCVLMLTPDRRHAVQAAARMAGVAAAASANGVSISAGIASCPEDGRDTWGLAFAASKRMTPITRWREVSELVATAAKEDQLAEPSARAA